MLDNWDAYTVNRSMNTTIGTAQTVLSKSESINTTNQNIYISRFVSTPINQTSIAANTWTLNIAVKCSSSNPYYPSYSTDFIPSCLYVWRPSSGTKVGTIFDGLSSTKTNQLGNLNEYVSVVNFTGSAVTGTQAGDIIVLEAMAGTNGFNQSGTYTFYYYFDGTTVNNTDNSATSNEAAYISTPENITFYTSTPITNNLFVSKAFFVSDK